MPNTVKVDYKVKPQNQTAEVGQTVTFICKSDFTPMWYYNGGDLPSNAATSAVFGHSSYILRLHNIQFQHEGIYTCYGHDEASYSFVEGVTKFYFQDKGMLTVIPRSKSAIYDFLEG